MVGLLTRRIDAGEWCPPCGAGTSSPIPCARHRDGPVEAVDYPRLGERVAYTRGDGTGTILAWVVKVAAHDGDAHLVFRSPDEWDADGYGWIDAYDVKPGSGPHTYQRLDMVPAAATPTKEDDRA